ncbi:M48 family metallopeptidase [Halodesulfovibrio aestuarii]|uniref:M48 family metallopeptidase n=1 Tax=Halodesulfovibrio aestuarii TaxID=126333 RepID=UPI0035211057
MIFREDGTIKYTLTRSNRAKHVRLKITRTKGLEIVVPETFKKAWLTPILEKRIEWIRKVAKRLELPASIGEMPPLIPEKIFLNALNHEYAVRCVSPTTISTKLVDAEKIIRTATGVLSIEVDGGILLPNTVTDEVHAELLRCWLVRCGKEYLPELLEEASAQVGIPYKKVQIRLQKGRWGSCSGRGTISLNARLLLLPADLLQYILLHELAHVRHPNHSHAYWNFLATLDARALENDRAMNDAWKHIPLCFSM